MRHAREESMDATDLLNQRIANFRAPSPGVSRCADELRARGFKVCSMEDLARDLSTRADEPIDREGATLAELLDEITGRNPGYVWTTAQADLINVYPAGSVLDEKVGELSVEGKGVYRILKEDLGIAKYGVSLFDELTSGDGPPVDLRLESADLREALNQIVGRIGSTVWHISGRPGAYWLTITGI